MTAGVGLNGQIDVFKSLSPVLSQAEPGRSTLYLSTSVLKYNL